MSTDPTTEATGEDARFSTTQKLKTASSILSIAAITLAKRDLGTKDKSQVRGPSLLWRFATSHPAGALGYLVWGGRKPSA
ncbi:MAG: hypothetical protein J2O48_12955 [Solirubrobacterales bacterium]|nr:hypothetical protein [Solirubrobacterales bacterium]